MTECDTLSLFFRLIQAKRLITRTVKPLTGEVNVNTCILEARVLTRK